MSDIELEEKAESKITTSIEEMMQQDVEDNVVEFEGLTENRKVPNIYRGKALNNVELYQMTARRETQLVLVAGLFHSGKTTMELAFYQMFLRGNNKRLQFSGSQTLIDVVERSRGLRVTSGNAVPTMTRTSNAEADNYLHLEIMDQKQKRHNIIFTDFAGEVFDYDSTTDNDIFLERFVGIKHVMVLVDGEKLAGQMKNQALVDCKNVLSRLIQKGIISDETTVHVVYSKEDLILNSKNPNIEEAISRNNDKMLKILGNRKGKFLIHRIAAISQDTTKINNYEGLEELLEACLDNSDVKWKNMNGSIGAYSDKALAQSSFDKFAWKG